MRYKYGVMVLLVLLIVSCGVDRSVYKTESMVDQQSYEVLDEALEVIIDVWNVLPITLNMPDETLLKVKEKEFVFLRLRKTNCDLCIVNMINYLNQFMSGSDNISKAYLIIDEMEVKEKANFISGFELYNIEVLYMESKFSLLDEIGGGLYFGKVVNGVIIDALPVDQLFTKEFIFSFLNKMV